MSEPALKLVPTVYKIARIPHASANEWWPHLSPFLEKSDRGSNGVELHIHFYMQWLSGDAQSWAIIKDDELEGAAMTRIVSTPTGNHLWIIALAGQKLDEWNDQFMAVIKAYGDTHECRRIFFQSTRKGAKKALKLGWNQSAVVYEYGGGP